jgi:chromatin remodeling complex protein RSC6
MSNEVPSNEVLSNEVETVQVPSNEVIINDELSDKFNTIIDSLSIFKTNITNIQNQMKLLEKTVKKQMKGLKKEVEKKQKKGNRKPSGFAKPSKVTKELCEFMNKQEGTEIARTEVTRALVSYIKQNNLENKDNSKIIYPDDKLKSLLDIKDNQELTYFNIQKYMNKHFNPHQLLEKV